MSAPYIANPEERILHRKVTDITLKIARPLVRYNERKPWPKSLSGGSCFILRFDDRLIGVTANHVIDVFQEDEKEDGDNKCILRTVPFDLMKKLLARSAELDLATFAITEDELAASEALALDCRSANWPPLTPLENDPISFAGFPEEGATPSFPYHVTFPAFMSLSRIQGITQRDIIATYEPNRDSRVVANERFPEVGANLSGCSGGPVILHYERNKAHHFCPVGMIMAGSKGEGAGLMSEFDTLHFRRIHFIQPDGSISDPDRHQF